MSLLTPWLLTAALAAGPANRLPTDVRSAATAAIDRGLTFLAATAQPDGGWPHQGRTDAAITALVAKCFIQSPKYGPDHPVTAAALARVLAYRQPDGGIYEPGLGLQNYYTSVALMALAASKDEQHLPAIVAARDFLKGLQWDESESIDATNPWYGGAGYGTHKRPDLSNTQLMIEALKESGLSPEDPAYRKAVRFVQRCQMLDSVNDMPLARGATDGGFIYTPVGNGESKAGTVVEAGQTPRLRSYGSMTYAGFKSYLYADLDRRDPRVRAALAWIQGHYTLAHNPNMPEEQSQEGLYYYYHVFARALHAWNEDILIDGDGNLHPWRTELCTTLVAAQRPDGSWFNDTGRWYEHNPFLVTAYAILALQTALD